MKKILLLLVSFFCFMSFTYAQNDLQEVVYLKNGSIIRGIIIEQQPNKLVKIQTSDGNVFVYKIDEVEKITKEPYYNTTRKKGNSHFQYRETNGYKGFLDLGYTAGTGDLGEDELEINGTYGYQFNPYLFLGVGTGVHYYFDSNKVALPIYADFRTNFMNNAITPFVGLKVGYSPFDFEGFYLNPNAGVRFALDNKALKALNFSMGYSMQKVAVDWGYYGTTTETVGGFNIKVGLEF
jgi:hypothetical protein